jgi:hypothetical protein
VNVCYNLVSTLKRQGHEVAVLTTDLGLDRLFAESLGADCVMPIHSPLSFGGMIYSPRMADWLRTHLREYEVIHLHEYRSYQNVLVHRFAALAEQPSSSLTAPSHESSDASP